MRISHLTVDDWANVDPSRMQHLVRAVTRRPGRWLFRYRSYGAEQIPAEGGFIVAPNHGSYADGFFFMHGPRRTIRFMAKHQALEWPLIGRCIRWGGGFPVRRGEDGSPGLAIARRILERGHGLVLFMEGRLVRTPELGEPRRGLAVLALQTGAPVVPVAAWGAKPAWVYGRRRLPWRRPRTTVVWGAPLRFERVKEPSPELVERVRDEIWAEVSRLHELARAAHEAPGGRPAVLDGLVCEASL